MMRTTADLAHLAAALAAAAPGLHDPAKARRADGAPSRHRYANLSDFVGDVREHLAAHGLTVIQGLDLARSITAPWVIERRGQAPVTGEGPVAPLVTRILHTSGEWLETDTPCSVWHDAQDQGKAITYAARYALLRALAMAAVDDDDDGQRNRERREAPKPAPEPAPEPAKPAAPARWSKPTQSAFFAELANHAPRIKYDDLAGWCEAHGKPRPSVMLEEQRAGMLAWLRDQANQDRVLEHAAKQAADGVPSHRSH